MSDPQGMTLKWAPGVGYFDLDLGDGPDAQFIGLGITSPEEMNAIEGEQFDRELERAVMYEERGDFENAARHRGMAAIVEAKIGDRKRRHALG